MSEQSQPDEENRPRRNKKQILDTAEEFLNKLQDMSETAEARLQDIEASADATAIRSKHVEDGAKYVVSARHQIEETQKIAATAASAAEEELSHAKTAATSIEELIESAQTRAGQTTTILGSTKEALQQAEQHARTVAQAAQDATAIKETIEAYESKLVSLKIKADETLKIIESLIPLATTAGLASSYGKRREQLSTSSKKWQAGTIFVLTVLIAVALYDSFSSTGSTPDDLSKINWVAVARHSVAFLPFVWLVLYCSRQASSEKRLEEEYAFKEAISRSFEGYKKQLGDLEDDEKDTPLKQLCRDTLSILASPPARIYDKHRLDVSPLTALADSVPALADALEKCSNTLKAIPRRRPPESTS